METVLNAMLKSNITLANGAESYATLRFAVPHHDLSCLQMSHLWIDILFDLIIYVPVNTFSVMSGRVFLG